MKVNVTGRGFIPGVNSIAPVYNQDLAENDIRRILNIPTLRVFDAASGSIITKKNVNSIFNSKKNKVVKNDQTKDNTKQEEVINTPVDTNTDVVETVEEVIDTTAAIVEETVDVVEEAIDETTEETVDEIAEETAEETAEESEEETVDVEDETETTETTADEKPYYNNKKNKKNRNR